VSEPTAQSPKEARVTQPKRRKLPRWWHIYLLLLVASFVVQLRDTGPDTLPDGYAAVDLPAQRSDGPVDEDPMAMGERRVAITPTTVHLAYQDRGSSDGPVVVLVHGSPGSSSDFDRLIPLLTERGYRVIAPDLPGFGYSDAYVPDYANRTHARYISDLLDELHIDSAHFVGFSMGGGVVINLYDLDPDRVASITMLAAIGVQEAEGSGDYAFEHLKYAVGYTVLVGGVELVPHFGLLGDRSWRHAFLRNFWDTDQRPNRAILERFDKPMLIIHGEADPLAPVRVAYDHHATVEQSELVIYAHDAFDSPILNHAMVLDEHGNGNPLVADALLPFLDRYRSPNTPPQRSTRDDSGGMKDQVLQLPGELEVRRSMNVWARIGVIMVGTFILEDPTSIAVGLFIKAGMVDPFVGGFALLAGIFVGDFGLYLIGYVVGRRALRWRPIAVWVPTRHVEKLGEWFDRKGWKAVLASRFIPGSRMPLYIAAGVTGNKPWRFMLWTFLAVCIWAPAILVAVVLLGDAARSPFQMILNFGGWPAFVAVVIVLMVAMHILLALVSREGRRKLAVRLQKQWKYEYWPGWKFYLPLVPYYAWLSFKHRSFTVWTLADPCMPDGGVVGESKSDILSRIDDPAVLKHALIPDVPGGTGVSPVVGRSPKSDASRLHRDHRRDAHLRVDNRVDRVKQIIAERGWSYPLILKPDAAQRGAGVKRIDHDEDLADWFEQCQGPAQLQQYHPGPSECGIFYTRMPGDAAGKIFSITDKVFPVITGDGKSDLEELIWKHPRFRFQHDVFHLRFVDELDRVLEQGQTLRLAEAGNHCQGTLFRDGAHLITPELESRIDELAKRLDGFYFGRIDIRYTDEASLKRGEGIAVIEINGVTSESTNLYDPSWSVWKAHAVLRKQWALCFAIGAAIRQRDGIKSKPWPRLLLDIRRYYRGRHVAAVSD